MLLDGGRGNVHSKDDVFDFTLSQTGHVDVVLLRIVSEDEILQFHLHVDPLLISERWPYVMRLRHDTLVGCQDDLGSLRVQVECPQDQDQSAEACEALDRLLPVVIEIEQKHLGLRGFKNTVPELFDFEASLERKLELATLDDDIREVKEVHLQWV